MMSRVLPLTIVVLGAAGGCAALRPRPCQERVAEVLARQDRARAGDSETLRRCGILSPGPASPPPASQ